MEGEPTLKNIFELLKQTNKSVEDLSTRVWILEQDPQQTGYMNRESDIFDEYSKQNFFQQDNPMRRNSILSTENAGLPRTPANNRRNKPNEQQSSSFTPHIVVESFKVPENEKMQSLTVRAVMGTKRIYDEYYASAQDKSRLMIDFISSKVRRELVDNELKLGTEFSHNLTYENIHGIDNRMLMIVLARKLRPRDHEEYQTKLFESITKFKTAKGYKDWTFGVNDYDEAMFGQVHKLLEEIVNLDEFFRLKATSDDLTLLPKLTYGKMEDQGAFWIFLQCFGDYRANFVAGIGEENLKKVKTVNEFKTLVTSFNEKFKTLALNVRQLNLQATPRVKAADTFQKVVSNEMQSKYKAGLEFKRSENPSLRAMEKVETVTELYDDLKESFDEGYLFKVESKQSSNSSATSLDKEQQANMPCFSFLKTKQCQLGKNCPYSHDKVLLEKHSEKRFAEFLQNYPYLEYSRALDITRKLKGISQTATPVSSPFERRTLLSERSPFQKKHPANSHLEIVGVNWESAPSESEIRTSDNDEDEAQLVQDIE